MSAGIIAAHYVDAGGGADWVTAMAAHSWGVWLRLGDSVGSGTAVDSSGNGRDGTPTNVTFGAAGLVAGDADTAASFNGSNSLVSVATGAWMDGADWTFLVALKRNGVPAATEYAGGRAADSSNGHFDMYVTTNGKVNARGFNTSNTSFVATSTTTVTDNVPHLCVMTCISKVVRIYVDDGTSEASATITGTARSTNTGNVVLGRRSGVASGHFTGTLDEGAFLPGVGLSDAQVSALMTAFA